MTNPLSVRQLANLAVLFFLVYLLLVFTAEPRRRTAAAGVCPHACGEWRLIKPQLLFFKSRSQLLWGAECLQSAAPIGALDRGKRDGVLVGGPSPHQCAVCEFHTQPSPQICTSGVAFTLALHAPCSLTGRVEPADRTSQYERGSKLSR